jgi:hypothetical protein
MAARAARTPNRNPTQRIRNECRCRWGGCSLFLIVWWWWLLLVVAVVVVVVVAVVPARGDRLPDCWYPVALAAPLRGDDDRLPLAAAADDDDDADGGGVVGCGAILHLPCDFSRDCGRREQNRPSVVDYSNTDCLVVSSQS